MAQQPNRCESERIDQPPDGTIEFGSADDRRRLHWVILINVYERGPEPADWNEFLVEVEARGIDRTWAHEELYRRTQWDDAHLYDGDLYPHYEERCDVGLLYHAMQQRGDTADLASLNTRLDERDVIQWSLWRIVVQNSDRRGARVDDVLDLAEQHGLDWIWAHELLQFWLDRGKLSRTDRGHVTPKEGGWRP